MSAEKVTMSAGMSAEKGDHECCGEHVLNIHPPSCALIR